MATGSGKTVVMSMVVAWAFCNRGQNPATTLFPNGVLICCPNLTVKERLQVLRPERPDNYYEAFDIVPVKYRPLLQAGKVLVTNWHRFAPESEHVEGGKSYAVVNKGPETPDTFARRVLEDLYDRLPIMVMNDEGHHCWRPAPATEEDLTRRRRRMKWKEARVWLDGLDRINNCTTNPDRKPGISICLDLSATPFYLKGSGYPEGRPFPWIVSDFGLVDAIESGIVKIPRLPVLDTTGRPDPKYFKLWKAINENLEPGERLPGKSKRPKPEVVYREAEGALLQIASQWKERFLADGGGDAGAGARTARARSWFAITPISPRSSTGRSAGKRRRRRSPKQTLPRCSARTTRRTGTATARRRRRKRRKREEDDTVYGKGAIFPELFSNTPDVNRTIRIDTKLLGRGRERRSEKEEAGRRRGAAAGGGDRGQAGAAGRARALRGVGLHADGRVGREQRHSHSGSAGLRQPVALRAGGGARAAADGLRARPEDRPAYRGVRGRLRHPVLGDPVQGAAGEGARRRMTGPRIMCAPCRNGRPWRCGSRWWRATPSRCGRT